MFCPGSQSAGGCRWSAASACWPPGACRPGPCRCAARPAVRPQCGAMRWEFVAPQPRQRTDCRSMTKMRASWWCTSAACCPEQDASASTMSAHAGVRPNTVATCSRTAGGVGLNLMGDLAGCCGGCPPGRQRAASLSPCQMRHTPKALSPPSAHQRASRHAQQALSKHRAERTCSVAVLLG